MIQAASWAVSANLAMNNLNEIQITKKNLLLAFQMIHFVNDLEKLSVLYGCFAPKRPLRSKVSKNHAINHNWNDPDILSAYES